MLPAKFMGQIAFDRQKGAGHRRLFVSASFKVGFQAFKVAVETGAIGVQGQITEIIRLMRDKVKTGNKGNVFHGRGDFLNVGFHAPVRAAGHFPLPNLSPQRRDCQNWGVRIGVGQVFKEKTACVFKNIPLPVAPIVCPVGNCDEIGDKTFLRACNFRQEALYCGERAKEEPPLPS